MRVFITQRLVLLHLFYECLHIPHNLVPRVFDVECLHESSFCGVFKVIAFWEPVEVSKPVDSFFNFFILVVVLILRDTHFEPPYLVRNKPEVFFSVACKPITHDF